MEVGLPAMELCFLGSAGEAPEQFGMLVGKKQQEEKAAKIKQREDTLDELMEGYGKNHCGLID